MSENIDIIPVNRVKSSAVLIPFLIEEASSDIVCRPHYMKDSGNSERSKSFCDNVSLLYEVRSSELSEAAGEVCFPGGHKESGETAVECAVRETCEELLISAKNIEDAKHVAVTCGPGMSELDVCTGRLKGYNGTFSESEVKEVFTVPLKWLVGNPPELYEASFETVTGSDFPEAAVTGQKNYRWTGKPHDIYVYEYEGHVIWGVTARITYYIVRKIINSENVI